MTLSLFLRAKRTTKKHSPPSLRYFLNALRAKNLMHKKEKGEENASLSLSQKKSEEEKKLA